MSLAEYVEWLAKYLREKDPKLLEKITSLVEAGDGTVFDAISFAHMYSKFFGRERSVEKIRELIGD